jgi:Coenzyme PQQ synthesis protein D (PqqD)
MSIWERLQGQRTATVSAIAHVRTCAFRRSPDVVWVTHLGETVLFNVDRGTYESLNEVASSIWELIVSGDGVSYDRIVQAIEEQYELPSGESVDRMAEDVASVLARLEKARAITSRPF